MTQRRKAWEVVTSKAGSGTIEATFDSLSPVAFVVDGVQQNFSYNKHITEKPVRQQQQHMLVSVAVVAALGMGVTYYKKRKAA